MSFQPAGPDFESKAANGSGETLTFDQQIVSFISQGKWDEVLLKLTSDMDPWDINLLELARRFASYIKEASRSDLKVPSKIVLAAAIIHRMKADTLLEVPAVDVIAQETNGRDVPNPLKGVAIPPIQLPLRREPKRKVSLIELMAALDKAMIIQDNRAARKILNIDLRGIGDKDISEQIEELFEKIARELERENIVKFSALLAPAQTKEERLSAFNSLLHLVRQERIAAWQKELFEEIFIKKVESAS